MAHPAKKRIHLILDKEDVRQLERLAETESLSVSWLIRRAIHQWLERLEASELSTTKSTQLSPRHSRKKDPMLSVMGLFNVGGISNAGIDREIYE